MEKYLSREYFCGTHTLIDATRPDEKLNFRVYTLPHPSRPIRGAEKNATAQIAPLDEELLRAVLWGTWQEVTRLLAGGSVPHAKTRLGASALSEAIRGKIEIAKRLIEHGANINKKDRYGSTLLMVAGLLRGREERAIVFLLNRGAAINAVDRDGSTAVIRAIHGCRYARAGFLIEKGADVHIRDKSGKSALDHLKGHAGKEAGALRRLLKKYTYNRKDASSLYPSCM